MGHATAAGAVTRYRLPKHVGYDVAVAADGSAWFATGTCRLARIAPAGHAISTIASPVPAHRLAFDPAGALLLASPARVVRHTPGTPAGACDDRPPALQLSPGRDDGTVSIRALRRAGGVRMTVREPAAVIAIASLDGPDGPVIDERLATPIIRGRRGGTGRYRFPAARLRRIERDVAAGKRWTLDVLASAIDAEGNRTLETLDARVTPLERFADDALELGGGVLEAVVVDDVGELALRRQLGLGHGQARVDLL